MCGQCTGIRPILVHLVVWCGENDATGTKPSFAQGTSPSGPHEDQSSDKWGTTVPGRRAVPPNQFAAGRTERPVWSAVDFGSWGQVNKWLQRAKMSIGKN